MGLKTTELIAHVIAFGFLFYELSTWLKNGKLMARAHHQKM
jgi:hypothetical protein